MVVTEGGTAVFTVSLSGPSANTIQVHYTTSSAGAGAGGDFSPAWGTLTFYPGQTAATVSVSTFTDNELEINEAFALQLIGPAGLSASAVGTIVDSGSGIGPASLCRPVGKRGSSGRLHDPTSQSGGGLDPGRIPHDRADGQVRQRLWAAYGSIYLAQGETQKMVQRRDVP